MRRKKSPFLRPVKHNFFLVVVLAAIVSGGFIGAMVNAYGTNDPQTFGHSAGEVEGTVPSGAVMAFNLPTCPNEWSQFGLANGRTIIGNSAQYPFSSTGGAATHTLTIAQMPSHTHKLYQVNLPVGGSTSYQNGPQGTYWRSESKSWQTTTPAGSSQPHNNMQPYIALTYCVKD